MDSEQISKNQGIALVIFFLLGSSAVVVPSMKVVGRDAWLTNILSIVLALIMVVLFIKLAKAFPEQTIIQYSQTVFGSIFGKLIGILYIFYFIYAQSLVVRVFGSFIVDVTLSETPLEFILMLMLALAAYSVIQGLEVIGRSAEFLMIILAFATLTFGVILLFEINFDNLYPIIEYGLKPVFFGTLIDYSFPFGEIVLFSMLLPYLKNIKIRKSAFLLGTLIGGLHLTSRPLFAVLVFGEISITQVFPLFSVFRNIPTQGMEVIFMVLYLLTGFIKISLYLWVGALAISQLFNLKTYKPLILPLAFLTLSLSLQIFDNAAEQLYFLIYIWPFFAIIFQVAIPALLLLAALPRS